MIYKSKKPINKFDYFERRSINETIKIKNKLIFFLKKNFLNPMSSSNKSRIIPENSLDLIFRLKLFSTKTSLILMFVVYYFQICSLS